MRGWLLALVLILAAPAVSAQATGCVVADNCASGAANALAQSAANWCASANGPPWTGEVVGPYPHTNGTHKYWVARINNGSGGFNGCGILPQTQFFFLDVTPEQCEARNSDPEQAPGPALFRDQEVGARCVGGCELDIVGDPTEVVQGRVQGQPANFYRFNRQYSGQTCDGTDPPGENEFEESDNEDGAQCNVSAGVCVTPEGDTEYCTFNEDGTPSVCVPAIDYDEDGIPDPEDTQPGDPENGADDGEGDESDNAASGGGSCGAAPTCTGDGIACAILYQTWATRCAVVALDGTGSGPGGDGEDDETGTFDPNSAAGQGTDPHPDISAVREDVEGSEILAGLDDSGFGLSRSCPALSLPEFEIAGYTAEMPWEKLCGWLEILAAVILLVGYIHAGHIVLRATGG